MCGYLCSFVVLLKLEFVTKQTTRVEHVTSLTIPGVFGNLLPCITSTSNAPTVQRFLSKDTTPRVPKILLCRRVLSSFQLIHYLTWILK